MESQQNYYDFLYKFTFIGYSRSGKSSLLYRLLKNQFNQGLLPTIGVQFGVKTIQLQSKIFKIQLWDTSGQERFKAITKSYYKGSVGMIFVFDVTNRKSFDYLKKQIEQIITETETNARAILVANKVDLSNRQVTQDQGREFAKKIGHYFEISCKQGGPIDLILQQLILDVYDQQKTLSFKWNQEIAPKQIFSFHHAPIITAPQQKIQFKKQVAEQNNANPSNSALIKTVLIGDSGSGKSSLLLRYVDNTFSSQYISTIGVDFKIKIFNHEEMNIKGQIWDTSGQERFKTITLPYYKGAKCFIIVYDCSDKSSFENIVIHLKKIQEHASNNIHKVLVGNKCQLPKYVSTDMGRTFALQNGLDFYEVSAKQNINVSKMFEESFYKSAIAPF